MSRKSSITQFPARGGSKIIPDKNIKYFDIGSRSLSPEKTFFIVEEGQANLGDFEVAIKMIDAVVDVDADAIEFQLARASDFYISSDENYKIYIDREFNDEQICELVSYTKSRNLEFIGTPLSHNLVDLLANSGCSAFNVNCSDLTNPDILDRVFSSGLPFFLSLPLANMEEIEWTVKRARKSGAQNFALLLGQHIMMTGENGVPIAETSLGTIAFLKEYFNLPVGFIDHTSLVWMPSAAVAAGSDIITKHLALSRSNRGPDWQICLEPNEMQESISNTRLMKISTLSNTKLIAQGEDKDRKIMRRSIVCARDLNPGHRIEREDLVFKRPGTGIDPINYEKIIGRTVKEPIKRDGFITYDNTNN